MAKRLESPMEHVDMTIAGGANEGFAALRRGVGALRL